MESSVNVANRVSISYCIYIIYWFVQGVSLTLYTHTLLSQCLSSLAMYSNDKPAQERVEIIDLAVVKFNETIEQLKKDQGKTNCIPVFYAQYSLARCLYNCSSLKTQLSRNGEISYNKEEVHALFCETVIGAYQAALEAGDMDQAQEIKSLDNLPW